LLAPERRSGAQWPFSKCCSAFKAGTLALHVLKCSRLPGGEGEQGRGDLAGEVHPEPEFAELERDRRPCRLFGFVTRSAL